MKKTKNEDKNLVQDNREQKNKSQLVVEPKQPMTLKVKPYSHQVIGYNLACRILGIFEGGG
jgi:hypothetical protein